MLPVESGLEPKRRRNARQLERDTDDGTVRKNVESATIDVPGIRPLQSEGTGKHVLFAHGPVRVPLKESLGGTDVWRSHDRRMFAFARLCLHRVRPIMSV